MAAFVGHNSGFPNFVSNRAGVPNIDNSSAPGETLKTLGPVDGKLPMALRLLEKSKKENWRNIKIQNTLKNTIHNFLYRF